MSKLVRLTESVSRSTTASVSCGRRRLGPLPDLRGPRAGHLGQRVERRHRADLPGLRREGLPRRYLRNEVNRGAAWNYNRLVEVARGSLFKWVAADDACEPAYLARCVDALDRDPGAVLAFPRTIVIDGDDKRLYGLHAGVGDPLGLPGRATPRGDPEGRALDQRGLALGRDPHGRTAQDPPLPALPGRR